MICQQPWLARKVGFRCRRQGLGPRIEEDRTASEVVREGKGIQKEKNGARVDKHGKELSQNHTKIKTQLGNTNCRTALNLYGEYKLLKDGNQFPYES